MAVPKAAVVAPPAFTPPLTPGRFSSSLPGEGKVILFVSIV
jgi:hypothetical protein